MTEPLARILTATDFSPAADVAVDRAAAIAARHGAELTLLHVVEPVRDAALALRVQEAAVAQLEATAARASGNRAAVTIATRTGHAWEEIVTVERELRPDLVVLGSRGDTLYSRLRLGSTADRVLRFASRPVLTVHPDDAARPNPLRRLLIATDFSDEATMAARAALRVVGPAPTGLELIFVHACDVPVEYGLEVSATVLAQTIADDEARAREQLSGLVAEVTGHLEPAPDVKLIVEHGYAASVIEQEAEAADADLIALGTHGRTGLRHFLLGSVAERVLHHAPCPVLTQRNPDAKNG